MKGISSFSGILLITIGVLLVGVALCWYFADQSWIVALLIAFVISLVNIVSGFFSIRWAFGRKARIFYSVMYGGMALRLILFVAALYFIVRHTQLPVLGFVVSFIVFYILFQLQEVRLIQNELAKQKR